MASQDNPHPYHNYYDDFWEWNKQDKSDEVSVLGDKNQIVLFRSGCNSTVTAGVRGTQILNGGRFYWEITIQDNSTPYGISTMFGIATKKARLHANTYLAMLGEDEHSWGLSHNGFVYHNGEKRKFTSHFAENKATTIGILFDGIKGTLTYYKDGVNLGVAFTDLGLIKDEIYPIICSTAAGLKMTLGITKREKSKGVASVNGELLQSKAQTGFGTTYTPGGFGNAASSTQSSGGLFGGSTSGFGAPRPTVGSFGATNTGDGLFGQSTSSGTGLSRSTVAMSDDTDSVATNPAAATPKKKAKLGERKPKTASTYPKGSEMILEAITNLKECDGSSLQAIKKYIGSKYKLNMDRLTPYIRKYLISAVASGALIQTKGIGASGTFKLSASGQKGKESSYFTAGEEDDDGEEDGDGEGDDDDGGDDGEDDDEDNEMNVDEVADVPSSDSCPHSSPQAIFSDSTDSFEGEGSETVSSYIDFKYLLSEAQTRARKFRTDLKELLLSGNMSDVTVKIKDREFKAHRNILAARSPIFSAMFMHDTEEKNTGIVNIEDTDPDAFFDFLLYLYTGSTKDVTAEKAQKLYDIADKYQMNELKNACIICMLTNISVENFCEVFAICLRHNEKDFKDVCVRFFMKKSLKIVMTSKWQEFLAENPIIGNELFVKHLQKCRC